MGLGKTTAALTFLIQHVIDKSVKTVRKMSADNVDGPTPLPFFKD